MSGNSGGKTGSRLTVGVVGAGSLGYHHIRILRDLPRVTMAGFHDIDAERAKIVSDRLEVDAIEELGELLADVDAAVIAVPTTDHRAVALAAVERGVHVLIEKPIASSLEDADRIIVAARSAKVIVQIGHVERFNPAIRAAEPYLDRPLFIESHRLGPFVPRSTDVAVVLDLMIHDVDLVRSLVGTPIREIAACGIPVLTSSVDIANARLTFEGGAVANLTASRVSMERMRKLRIFQESGYLSLNLADGTGEFLRLKEGFPFPSKEVGAAAIPDGGLGDLVERIPLVGSDREPLATELENFRDAVLDRRPPLVSGESGRDALAVALSIEESIRRR